MDWICSQCGCRSKHYNRRRMRYECDSCGQPVIDRQQEQMMMEYDRAFAQAQSHLTAGNWGQVITLIKPLTNQNPTDKRLYMILLRATTRDFHDLEMTKNDMRMIASESWDKLIRLHGVDSAMIRYSRARYNLQQLKLKQERNIIVFYLLISAFCFIGAFMFDPDSNWGIMLILICLGIYCMRILNKRKPFQTLNQLAEEHTCDFTQNPFL